MKNLIVISGLVVALATGSSVAQAGPGQGGGEAGAKGKAPQSKSQGKSKGKSKRCAKVRKVGFVVAGTFVRGTAATSGTPATVTLKVTRANRHATKSGLVTVGMNFTATSSRIRYVNRTGPGDAQDTDKVKVVGKVTQLKRKCSAEGFVPVATIRSVKVKGPDAVEPSEPDAVEPSEPEVPGGEAGI
ncbi:MAG: hypothetical protein H0U24_05230 [Thermoleophilaceae bacterium]|nr:hypothetical protein [Thermoleophilaceae bacterium]